MEGWRPAEDLVRWGFAHSPVVMASEAHDGKARDQAPLPDGWSGGAVVVSAGNELIS